MMRRAARLLLNMTNTSARPQIAAKRICSKAVFSVLGSVAILVSGCAGTRKKASIPWSTAVLVRPVVQQHSSSFGNADDSAPDLKLDIPTPPPPLAVGRVGPARPRGAAPAANQNAPGAKLDTPQIVPELSAKESASLQRETEQSLSAAERSLATTPGKSLNATQADLASKVRSFISDAREAGKAGDWARARDLSKKAQVLAEELVRSL